MTLRVYATVDGTFAHTNYGLSRARGVGSLKVARHRPEFKERYGGHMDFQPEWCRVNLASFRDTVIAEEPALRPAANASVMRPNRSPPTGTNQPNTSTFPLRKS